MGNSWIFQPEWGNRFIIYNRSLIHTVHLLAFPLAFFLNASLAFLFHVSADPRITTTQPPKATSATTTTTTTTGKRLSKENGVCHTLLTCVLNDGLVLQRVTLIFPLTPSVLPLSVSSLFA